MGFGCVVSCRLADSLVSEPMAQANGLLFGVGPVSHFMLANKLLGHRRRSWGVKPPAVTIVLCLAFECWGLVEVQR